MNLKQIILSAKTGTTAPTTVVADFIGQLYIDTVAEKVYYAQSLTMGDYEEISETSDLNSHINDLNDPHDTQASQVETDTTNFNGVLSSNEDTVQKALDILDDVVQDLENASIETVFFQPDQSHNFNNYRVNQLSTAGSANYSFFVPTNFVSLISLEVIFIPTNTIGVGQTIDLVSNYAAIGELSTVNSESSLGTAITGTANTITVKDISSIFTNITAGDICGFNWKNNNIGTSIAILCIKMVYNSI